MPEPAIFALTWAARIAADVKREPESKGAKYEEDLINKGKAK